MVTMIVMEGLQILHDQFANVYVYGRYAHPTIISNIRAIEARTADIINMHTPVIDLFNSHDEHPIICHNY
jgi:hypothetical protein